MSLAPREREGPAPTRAWEGEGELLFTLVLFDISGPLRIVPRFIPGKAGRKAPPREGTTGTRD